MALSNSVRCASEGQGSAACRYEVGAAHVSQLASAYWSMAWHRSSAKRLAEESAPKMIQHEKSTSTPAGMRKLNMER